MPRTFDGRVDALHKCFTKASSGHAMFYVLDGGDQVGLIRLGLRVLLRPRPQVPGRSWSRKTACPCTPESPRRRTRNGQRRRDSRDTRPQYQHITGRGQIQLHISTSIVRTPAGVFIRGGRRRNAPLTVNHMALQFRLLCMQISIQFCSVDGSGTFGGWTGLGTSPPAQCIACYPGPPQGMAERSGFWCRGAWCFRRSAPWRPAPRSVQVHDRDAVRKCTPPRTGYGW